MDCLNVRDFGALGDGKDYTSQIQLVLNIGGRVYIPKGTYMISNPLVIKKNTHIVMDSDTILKRGAIVTINDKATTALQRTSGPYAINLLEQINSKNATKLIYPKKNIISVAEKEYGAKKIKIRLKKEPYGIQYQIQFAKTKKFNKPIMTVTTNKRYVSFTNKKFMKRKRMYVRVRVIKKQAGIIYKTKWTSANKVTMTKTIKVRYKLNGKWTKPRNKKIIL